MIPTHDLIIDQFAPSIDSGKRLTTWYAQGHSDGLGDRLLMFDNTTSPSWEILRFKPALAKDPKFEAALRQRVEQLGAFQHSAFPVVRPIKKLGHEDGLAVVSTYAAGASLAEALKKPRAPEFSLRLIRQLVPALVALRQHAPALAHGALSPDRIILTPEGHLMIREHMVGPSIESLELPDARLWTEFGILVPASSGSPRLDERCDIAQLAIIAVSLMAGRPIGPEEYPGRMGDVLDEVVRRTASHGAVMTSSFCHWLERAMQLDENSFASALDAQEALRDLEDEPQRSEDPFEATLREAPVKPTEVKSDDATPPMWSAARALPSAVDPGAASPQPGTAESTSGAVKESSSVQLQGMTWAWKRMPRPMRWAALTIGVFALAEAVVIGTLVYRGSTESTTVATPITEATTPRAEVLTSVPTANAPPAVASLPLVTTATIDAPIPELREVAAPVAPPRRGGFRVSAPIELHVLDGDRIVGSSADGPVIVPTGRRDFEFVNSAIGYRSRQTVDVRAGQITSVAVTIPNGVLNINAVPWADVWIDGTPYGETPLGNISVAPGEHEILFRHPQLGERRQRVLVRADTPTRVAVTLQR